MDWQPIATGGEAMNDWHEVMYVLPPENEPVEFMRDEWLEPRVLVFSKLHSEMNMVGLRWRRIEGDARQSQSFRSAAE